ncbi:hypothetical protein [Herbaspirillum chlorophenolicum]|uniref:hypothetical protein n=1 Tax=Herbaspirillum chlorophenolicum TaxID=211589 RepID=UPI00067E0AA0|nr:hypothetical protein [Herbaspirillum chlorophenolicum]
MTLLIFIFPVVVPALIGICYFLQSRDLAKTPRIAVSIAGPLISFLYLASLAIGLRGYGNAKFTQVFSASLIVPCIFILYTLIKYKGPKKIHTLQVFNVLALIDTYFVGTMAIADNWL